MYRMTSRAMFFCLDGHLPGNWKPRPFGHVLIRLVRTRWSDVMLRVKQQQVTKSILVWAPFSLQGVKMNEVDDLKCLGSTVRSRKREEERCASRLWKVEKRVRCNVSLKNICKIEKKKGQTKMVMTVNILVDRCWGCNRHVPLGCLQEYQRGD